MRAPRRSISALVATVLLWVWTRSASASPVRPRVAATSSMPLRMLAPGCEGVLGALKQRTSPAPL